MGDKRIEGSISGTGTVAVVVGLLTALGTTLTILSRYVTADTLEMYKEGNTALLTTMDRRTERIEGKIDAMLLNQGIVVNQKGE